MKKINDFEMHVAMVCLMANKIGVTPDLIQHKLKVKDLDFMDNKIAEYLVTIDLKEFENYTVETIKKYGEMVLPKEEVKGEPIPK